MADYNAKILTNYFAVNNETEFRGLMASCMADDEIEVFQEENSDKTTKFGFGCYGILHGIPDPDSEDDEDGSVELFYESLQKLLHPDDAIIITEIGHEKLNYFIALCTVITRDNIKHIDARAEAVKLAGELLGNPGFTTKMDY